MEYAWANPIRANRRYEPGDLIQDLYGGGEVFKRSCIPSPAFRIPRNGVHVMEEDSVWQVRPGRGVAMTHLHTNACGDFTLLSREGWYAIRGYPEFEAFSWNIDSIGFIAAHYAGYQEVSLLPPCVCFHIEHGIGSGWTPEGERSLFDRLRQAQILTPEWPVLAPLVDEMRDYQRALEFNHSNWGMADFDLPERPMGDSTEPPTERLNQLSLFAEQKRISAIQPEYDLDRLTLAYERRVAEANAMTPPLHRVVEELRPIARQTENSNPGFVAKHAAVIVGAAYLIMLLCIWSPFAATSGMGWETYYTVKSETATSWKNFLYTPDPLRIHAANFYELAYRIGDVLGIRGSFFPYQLIYAFLWWARSFLGFLIIRRLFPDSLVLPFVIGAIMLVHAPDLLMGWLGQLHQLGYFVWLLAAIYLLIKALQQTTVSRAIPYAVAACPLVYLCLWTYEGPLFIIAAAPFLLVFLVRPKPIRLAIWPSVLWYVVPLIYVCLSLQRYLNLGGSPYQQSLLRKSFAPTAILSDWFFNVWYSLSFLSWLQVDSHLSNGQIFLQAASLLLVFLAAGWLLARRDSAGSQPFFKKAVLRLLISGLVLLFLSFPAQLLLEAARQPRRTQLLSAIAASIVLGAALVLIAEILPHRWSRSVVAIGLAVPIVWLGSWRTIEREGGQRAEWDVHLTAMKQLLRTVPRVQEGTVVVMTNVPKGADPFYSYNFWFDNALRLAYPRTTVAGVYYYDDGSAAPVANLRLREGRWEYTGEGVSPLIQSAEVDRTLVLQYNNAGGEAKVLAEIPAFVCSSQCTGLSYRPDQRLLAGSPAPEPSRRYGPL
jgi:hypothetical protein